MVHCKNDTLDTHYNEVLIGVYNRMKGNSTQGFVNTAQVPAHTCSHANKHVYTSRLNGIHTFIIHTFTQPHGDWSKLISASLMGVGIRGWGCPGA